MSEIRVTYRFTRAAALTSLTVRSNHVPRVGEIVHLMGFTAGTANEPFEYSGIAKSTTWIVRPHDTEVTIILY